MLSLPQNAISQVNALGEIQTDADSLNSQSSHLKSTLLIKINTHFENSYVLMASSKKHLKIQEQLIINAQNDNLSVNLFKGSELDSLLNILMSPDGQFIYSISNTGLLSKFEISQHQVIGQIKVNGHSSHFSISNNGEYLIIANSSEKNLAILSTDNLTLVKTIELSDKSQVMSLDNIPPRYSFIIGFHNSNEIWEIPYSDQGGVELYKGWAHDYRKDAGEGTLEQWKIVTPFPIRKITLQSNYDQLDFDSEFINLIIRDSTTKVIEIYNLDVKKRVSVIRSQSAFVNYSDTWQHQHREIFALAEPNFKQISLYDIETGIRISSIEMTREPFYLYSHIKSDFILIASCSDEATMTLRLLNKKTQTLGKLKKVAHLHCLKNETLTFQFSPNGNYFMHIAKPKKHHVKLSLYKVASLEKVKEFMFNDVKKIMPLTSH